jgi:hypothetical protein
MAGCCEHCHEHSVRIKDRNSSMSCSMELAIYLANTFYQLHWLGSVWTVHCKVLQLTTGPSSEFGTSRIWNRSAKNYTAPWEWCRHSDKKQMRRMDQAQDCPASPPTGTNLLPPSADTFSAQLETHRPNKSLPVLYRDLYWLAFRTQWWALVLQVEYT